MNRRIQEPYTFVEPKLKEEVPNNNVEELIEELEAVVDELNNLNVVLVGCCKHSILDVKVLCLKIDEIQKERDGLFKDLFDSLKSGKK